MPTFVFHTPALTALSAFDSQAAQSADSLAWLAAPRHGGNGAASAAPSDPAALLDVVRHRLTLRGDSCLAEPVAFYGPLIARLRAHLDHGCGAAFDVDMALGSFDTSNAKMLFALFDTLHEAALAGKSVVVHWFAGPGDRRGLKFRTELRERFPRLAFH